MNSSRVDFPKVYHSTINSNVLGVSYMTHWSCMECAIVNSKSLDTLKGVVLTMGFLHCSKTDNYMCFFNSSYFNSSIDLIKFMQNLKLIYENWEREWTDFTHNPWTYAGWCTTTIIFWQNYVETLVYKSMQYMDHRIEPNSNSFTDLHCIWAASEVSCPEQTICRSRWLQLKHLLLLDA